MTSGNIAVFDHDAWRFADFVVEFNRLFGIDEEQTVRVEGTGAEFLAFQEAGPAGLGRPAQDQGADPGDRGPGRRPGLRHAAGAARVHGPALLPHRHHRQGADPSAGHRRHRRAVRATASRPRSTWPASCPIRTARTASAPRRSSSAVRTVRAEGQTFEVWLYRGAWEEWEPHEIERVVPLSPDDLERKKQAIFRHQSQKDRAMFPGGADRREFWQRAEDRNRHTADALRQARLAGVLRPGGVRAVARRPGVRAS